MRAGKATAAVTEVAKFSFFFWQMCVSAVAGVVADHIKICRTCCLMVATTRSDGAPSLSTISDSKLKPSPGIAVASGGDRLLRTACSRVHSFSASAGVAVLVAEEAPRHIVWDVYKLRIAMSHAVDFRGGCQVARQAAEPLRRRVASWCQK